MLKLATLTEQEIELVSRLLSLQEEELEAIKRADTSSLPVLGEHKLKLIEQLNALESIRADTLGCKAGEDVRAAMEAWLARHPDQPVVAGNWKKLLDLARQAKQQHELNSQLVNMCLQQTNEILAALTSHPAHRNTLYGSNGQASPSTGSRIVDSA